MVDKGCDNCYYEYFDEKAYPCSLCIRGVGRTDKWQPSKRIKADTPRSDCCTCKHSKEKAETAYPYCRLCGYNNESNYIPQTGQYDYNKSEMENIKLGNGISREIPTPDCP